jgi:hypothetical protein
MGQVGNRDFRRAVICVADDFVAIAEFGRKKRE